MRKVGKLISTEQQLCYAHAVQPAVLDVLYKRRPVSSPRPNVQSAENDEVDDKPDDAALDEEGHVLELEVVDDSCDMVNGSSCFTPSSSNRVSFSQCSDRGLLGLGLALVLLIV